MSYHHGGSQHHRAGAASGRADRDDKAINRAITKAGNTGRVDAIVDVIRDSIDRMNLINISTSLHRMAKLAQELSNAKVASIRGQPCFVQLQHNLWGYISQLGEDPQKMDASSDMRCLSIVCWSYATLGISDKPLFDVIADLSLARWQELKPFEASNVLWAFSKLNMLEAHFLRGVVPHLMRMNLEDSSPQVLSTLCWAFGRASYHPKDLFNKLSQLLHRCADKLAPQGIANTLWAFAKLQRQDAGLFNRLGEAALRANASNFKPQELSNIAWAFASVRMPFPALFDAIARGALNQQSQLQPQNISNLIWAFAKVQPESPSCGRLFEPLLALAASKIKHYKPKEISALLWGVSRVPEWRQWEGTYLPVFLREMKCRLDAFPPQSLACTADALTSNALCQPECFDFVVCKCLGKLPTFEPPSLVALLRSLAEEAVRRPDDYALQECLWTLSEHIAASWESMMPHHVEHLASTLQMMPPALYAAIENLGFLCCGGSNASMHQGHTWEVPPSPPALSERKQRKKARVNRFDCRALANQESDVVPCGTYPTLSEWAVSYMEASARGIQDSVAAASSGSEEKNVERDGEGIVGMFQQTFQGDASPTPQGPASEQAQAQPSDHNTKGKPSTSACGMVALDGSSLVVKGTFLEIKVPPPLARRRKAQTAPATPTRASAERAQRDVADKGVIVNAAWARLRSEVPSLPRCETILMKANQRSSCNVAELRTAGGLIDASWVDTEVAGAMAVMLRQCWLQHGCEMAQCPTCLKCFDKQSPTEEALKSVAASDMQSTPRSSTTDQSQDDPRVPRLCCAECASSGGSTVCDSDDVESVASSIYFPQYVAKVSTEASYGGGAMPSCTSAPVDCYAAVANHSYTVAEPRHWELVRA
mmetsp:Transcript_57522/g.186877  ORF Transcript_57522/g.186877 Transcript_57522/m.186877 type:complete len:882 (+) Transcript_57522:92-2737(+)